MRAQTRQRRLGTLVVVGNDLCPCYAVGANLAINEEARNGHVIPALRTQNGNDPSAMLERKSEELGLSPHLRSLLQQHLPTKVESVTADSLIA